MGYRSPAIPMLVLPLLAAADAVPEGSTPGYRQSLEDFRSERAKQSGSALTADDRAVMTQATADLAEDLPEPGLRVGLRAPAFSLPNAVGEEVSLADLLAEAPVVLTFYRGAWCPYCNLDPRTLHEALPQIERQDARLVALTPQQPDRSREQLEKDGDPFEVLSDLDDRVMQAYGLYFEVPAPINEVYQQRLGLDLAEYNGPGRYVLPVPATFVIDRGGVIRASFADVDYRQRMEPAAIIAALQPLDRQ